MIVLFTDFGLDGPYTGQMKAVLHQMAPGIPIIDLFADAPAGNPKLTYPGSGSLKAEKTSRHAAVDRQQASCGANSQDSWQALRQQISGGLEAARG